MERVYMTVFFVKRFNKKNRSIPEEEKELMPERDLTCTAVLSLRHIKSKRG